MAVIFFSYSHADEILRDQLEQHLSLLKRQGLVETWHDRRIVAGDEIDSEINENLTCSDIILLLVSSSFISSEYCYSNEMRKALELHEAGQARVIPIILRPCDWHSAPFGKLLAIPKDGKPVTMWANPDEAFTDISKQIRSAVEKINSQNAKLNNPSTNQIHSTNQTRTTLDSEATFTARSSNLRLSKRFTDFEKDEFLHSTFDYLGRFFEGSLEELKKRNTGINTRFQRIDGKKFTAVIYRDGKSVAECTIRIGNLGGGSAHLAYSYSASASDNSSNEMLHLESDNQSIFLKSLMMQSHNQSNSRLSEQGAAEYFWSLLIDRLQH